MPNLEIQILGLAESRTRKQPESQEIQLVAEKKNQNDPKLAELFSPFLP